MTLPESFRTWTLKSRGPTGAGACNGLQRKVGRAEGLKAPWTSLSVVRRTQCGTLKGPATTVRRVMVKPGTAAVAVTRQKSAWAGRRGTRGARLLAEMVS